MNRCGRKGWGEEDEDLGKVLLLDLRVIQFCAEMLSASRHRAGWARSVPGLAMREVKRQLPCLEESTPHASPGHDPLVLSYLLVDTHWLRCTSAGFCSRGSSLLDLGMPQGAGALFIE